MCSNISFLFCCSSTPIRAGDTAGALRIVALDERSLPMIKYTYNVTNSGNSAVSNARIVDDKLGQIDDGPFGLESGESESFEKLCTFSRTPPT